MMNTTVVSFLSLGAGFVLMIVGADRLIKGAIDLALKLNLSKVFIGAVFVGFGTSAPELVTSLYSAYSGEGVLAAGNVIGSNIFNSSLVMGTCLLFPFILSKSEKSLQNAVLLILPSVLIFVFASDLKFTVFEGILLLIPLPIFLYLMMKEGVGTDEVEEHKTSIPLDFFWITAGAVALFIGSTLSIKASLNLVDLFGISKGFAGAVILAAGTGLPELVTTIVAGFKKEMSLAFANILGSNALNVFGVLSLSAIIFPFDINQEMATFNAPVLLAVSVFGLMPIMIFKNQAFLKTWAAVLFGAYLVFSWFSF
jgi:cation:H+ antiporter